MQITPSNVGDIIRMDHKARYIQIEAVDEKLVHYRQETGERYATSEREIAGVVVLDPNRISEFRKNSALGAALNGAEYRAVCGLLNGNSTPEEIRDADKVLASVKAMQRHLDDRVSQRQQQEAGKHHPASSLDAMISRASADAKSKQHGSAPTIGHEFDRS